MASVGLKGSSLILGCMGGVIASCQHVECFTRTNLTFLWMVSSSLLQYSRGAIFCLLTGFHTLDLSSLVCGSVIFLFIVFLVTYMRVRVYFVLCVTSKSSFVQLQVCISLAK